MRTNGKYDLNGFTTDHKLESGDKKILEGFIAAFFPYHTEDYKEVMNSYFKKAKSKDFETKNIMPQAGYVCKTKVLGSSLGFKNDLTAYITICYNCNITPPPAVYESDIQSALNYQKTPYNLPFILGRPLVKEDKELLINAVIQTQAFSRSLKDTKYKIYVMEHAIACTEKITRAVLSRNFEMPEYMINKGIMEPIAVRLPKEELVFQMMDEAKAREEWKIAPRVIKKTDEVIIVIEMPGMDHPKWETRLTEAGLELWIDKKKYCVKLQYSIDYGNKDNKVDFYKKNKTLVAQFKLLERRQYM